MTKEELETRDKIKEVNRLLFKAKEIHIADAQIKGKPVKIVTIYPKEDEE